MEKIKEVQNMIEKTVGVETKKVCEFCGKELEQIFWKQNNIKFYAPAWKKCSCPAALEKLNAEKKAQEEAEKERLLAEREERRKNRISRLLGASGMSARAKNCLFEGYQLNIYNEKAFQICKSYTEKFNTIKKENKNGLFIAGPCGVGKSHLANAIANDLIRKGQSVISMTMIDLLLQIKNSYSAENINEKEILKIYEDCTLLIIDDLGKEKPTEWALQMIYSIIDKRYNSLKPIVVTTNYTASELINRLTISSDKSSAEAIVDRLFEICEYIPITGDSFRKNA